MNEDIPQPELQADNRPKNNNPQGKGGFQDHPELINRDGRPHKGNAWSEILEELGERFVLDGEGLPTTVTWKKAVGEKLWEKCLDGDTVAMKELFNRMEGLPRIKMEVEGHTDPAIPMLVERIDKLLEIGYGQGNSTTDNQGDS